MLRRRWLLVVAAALVGCGPGAPDSQPPVLRVALHAEPQTWNRILAADWATHVVTDQIHAPLIRIDPITQELEPALAESWKFSKSGTTLTVHLRQDVRFSDGHPFTARDVAFTFRALYDPTVGSPLVTTAQVDGQPLEVEVLDDATVAFTVPRKTAALERMFDSVAILPAHRLQSSLERGSLVPDTGTGVAVEDVVGLGPFRPTAYLPGERIVLERNPHYWNTGPNGDPLPRLSGIVFEILPDPSARLLRFRAGGIDVLEPLAPEAFETLRASDPGHLELIDVGPSMLIERLWFNLNPKSPVAEHKQAWFRDDRFRRAVSLALDRKALARVVYRGLASPAAGPVSPANRIWWDPSLAVIERDLDAARGLLRQAGFGWDDEDRLRDEAGRPVAFTIVTKAASDVHARMGAFVQEDLNGLGMEVRIAPVEASSLAARLTASYDYEACLLGISQTEPDPSAQLAFWLSSSQLHLWHPLQPEPATPWEARIDRLMRRQLLELDLEERREAFYEVQRIVYERLPVIDLVVPHALVGANRRVRSFRPNPFTHSLWNAAYLDVETGGPTHVGVLP